VHRIEVDGIPRFGGKSAEMGIDIAKILGGGIESVITDYCGMDFVKAVCCFYTV